MRFTSIFVAIASFGAGAGSADVAASDLGLIIDPMFGSTEDTGSSALITLSFMERGKDDVLSITIENTTSAEIDSAITAVGLELPDALDFHLKFAPSGTSGYFDALLYDERFSPGWLNAPGGYDIVIAGDDSFLGGSPRGAPMAGESETISFFLGDTGLSMAELAEVAQLYYATETDNFLVGRFQMVGANGEDSDKVRGGIPEPATGLLLLTGSLALVKRRRAKIGWRGHRAE